MKILIEETAYRTRLVEIPDKTPHDQIIPLAEQAESINDDLEWKLNQEDTSYWRPATSTDEPQPYCTVEDVTYIEVT